MAGVEIGLFGQQFGCANYMIYGKLLGSIMFRSGGFWGGYPVHTVGEMGQVGV